MDLITLDKYLSIFSAGFKPPYLGSIPKWAEENVILPMGYNPSGPIDLSISPYFIAPLQSLRDNDKRQVMVMASPRSGKTLLAELFLLYLVANDPGPALWIQSSNEQMAKIQARMRGLLKACQPTRDLIDSEANSVTQKHFKFGNGMLVNLGSAKIRDLQSIGYRFIFGDECWLWDKGKETALIAEAQARVGDFPKTSKILLFSQGGVVGDEWTTEFNSAPLYEWGWICPKCNGEQIFHFNFVKPKGGYAGLIWEPIKDENDNWKINEAAKTAKLVCVECSHKIEDTPSNREYLNSTGKYICTKADGDPKKISYRWNALANPQVSFCDLATEWLFADSVYDFNGENELKKIFEQKRLARPHGLNRIAETVNINLEAYDPSLEWKDEFRRFLTVDVQRKSPRYWYVCRAWAKNGDSRLIEYGHVDTWEDVEALIIKHKVKENRVFVDAGDGVKEQEIVNECAKHGRWVKVNGQDMYLCWIACHGVKQNEFSHRKQDGMQYPYGQEEKKAVQLGNDPKYRRIRGCPYHVWSNTRIKNMLWHLISGKGPQWVANNVSEEYKRHLSSEVLVPERVGNRIEERWKKITPDARNEWLDTEALQCLAASINKILSINPPKKEEELKQAA